MILAITDANIPGLDIEVDGCAVTGLTIQGFTGAGALATANGDAFQNDTLKSNGAAGLLLTGTAKLRRSVCAPCGGLQETLRTERKEFRSWNHASVTS